jgi:hypothetical protein
MSVVSQSPRATGLPDKPKSIPDHLKRIPMRAILGMQSPRLSASLLDPDEIRLLRKALGDVEKTKMKTPAERASSQIPPRPQWLTHE